MREGSRGFDSSWSGVERGKDDSHMAISLNRNLKPTGAGRGRGRLQKEMETWGRGVTKEVMGRSLTLTQSTGGMDSWEVDS